MFSHNAYIHLDASAKYIFFFFSPRVIFFILFLFFVVCCSAAQSCRFSATPWSAAYQASLFFTISWSLLKLMSIESVMPSNRLILCCPLLLMPWIFPSMSLFQCVTYHTLNHPEVYSSVVLSIFIFVCSSHHHPFPELFILQNWSANPISRNSPFSPS